MFIDLMELAAASSVTNDCNTCPDGLISLIVSSEPALPTVTLIILLARLGNTVMPVVEDKVTNLIGE
jgi:hypothetical protein